MSININRVTIAGYLGRDPEISKARDGAFMAVLSLATTDHWTDKRSGERRSHTEWHRVVIWNQHLVRVARDWLVKGSAVYVEGRLESRRWQEQDGRERHITEIVLRAWQGELKLLDRAPGRDQSAKDRTAKGTSSPSPPQDTSPQASNPAQRDPVNAPAGAPVEAPVGAPAGSSHDTSTNYRTASGG